MTKSGSDLLRRIERSASRVADLEAELRGERRRRNELSRAAIDTGIPHRSVARAARVRPSTLTAAVAELDGAGPDVVGPTGQG